MTAGNSGQRSSIVTVPIEAGGWNTLTPVNQLPGNRYPIYQNFVPGTGGLRIRNSFKKEFIAEGSFSKLVVYTGGFTGVNRERVFAIGDRIVEITDPLISVDTGIVSGDAPYIVSYTNHLDYLYLTGYRGGIYRITGDTGVFTNVSSTFSGVDVTFGDFFNPAQVLATTCYQSRIYFGDMNKNRIWYSGVGEIQGELTPFQISTVGADSSGIASIFSYSFDTNSTVSSFLCVWLANGTLLLYTGDFPGADDFSLKFALSPGKPLSSTPFVKIKNDLILLSNLGFLSLRSLLSYGSDIQKSNIAEEIQPEVTAALNMNPTASDLWHGTYHESEELLLITGPTLSTYDFLNQTWATDGGTTFCYSTRTQSWVRWSLGDGQALLASANNKLYAARNGNNTVSGIPICSFGRMQTGPIENSLDDRNVKLLTGFTNLPANNSRIVAFDPGFLSDGPVNFTYAVLTNFNKQVPAAGSAALPGSITGYSYLTWTPPSWSTWSAWALSESNSDLWFSCLGTGSTAAIYLNLINPPAVVEFLNMKLKILSGRAV